MSITLDAAATAKAKVRQWQGEIRDHVDRTGLIRQPNRERLNTVR